MTAQYLCTILLTRLKIWVQRNGNMSIYTNRFTAFSQEWKIPKNCNEYRITEA
jgi:hypothetical protein